VTRLFPPVGVLADNAFEITRGGDFNFQLARIGAETGKISIEHVLKGKARISGKQGSPDV